MNRRQRESLAKFFYVIAQITFGGLVIGTLAQRGPLDIVALIAGIILTALEVIVALWLESNLSKKGAKYGT